MKRNMWIILLATVLFCVSGCRLQKSSDDMYISATDTKTEELSKEMLMETVSHKLDVPDDENIVCEVSEKYFWESANRYYRNVTFFQAGEIVAFASVDPTNGDLLRNIHKYNAGDDGTKFYAVGKLAQDVAVAFKDENDNVLLDNTDIVSVYAKFSGENAYYIELEMTDTGGSKFAKATRENIGKTIRVCADDAVLLAPVVVCEITGNTVVASYCESYEALMTIFNKLTHSKN